MLIVLNTIQGCGVGDIESLVWGWSSELLHLIRHVLQMLNMANGFNDISFHAVKL